MTKISQSQSRTALSLLLQMTFGGFAPLVLASPTFAQSTFTDVQGNWSQSCISQLAQQGIISGYPDGTFRPNASVTRSEFAAMIGKAFPNAQKSRNLVQFADVPSNYWAHNAIATANQTGFLSGYPGEIFNPTQNIPRAQVLVALASGLNYSPTQSATTTLTANFADASSIPTYAQSGIAAATEKRLVVDYPDVKFLRPNQLASRAEVSAFLCLALTPSGQTSSIPGQYIANATGSSINALLNSGTSIPVKYLDAKKIVVSSKETAPLTLTVATDIKNNQGVLTIPAGSQVVGQLQPVDGGSQFVASQLIINGQQFPINASSRPITTTQDVRSPNITAILQDAAVGSAAAAGISGITGNKHITLGKVLTGTAIGTAVGANQNRNVFSTLRDTAIGAAAATGISGITGNRTITPGKVLGGAAAGATIGGIVDPTSTNQVVVINPNSDLTLSLNSDFSR
ncbi:MAG: S-layer homology domain-containing protein [Nostoc sp.]|uniref:S-layer homology domain-containing protein n=1 Tax=Nostoc sp. TaxID=1180 RepID=UPI002FEF801F